MGKYSVVQSFNLMLPSASSSTIRSARLCSGDAFISSDGGPLNSGGGMDVATRRDYRANFEGVFVL